MRRCSSPAIALVTVAVAGIGAIVVAAPVRAQSGAAASQAATAPAAPGTAPTTTAADPFAEAADLVEAKANTQANLNKAIALYEAALVDDKVELKKRAAAWTDLSRAYQRLGDALTNHDAQLAAYTKGKAAGDRAFSLDPRSANALFWATANQACIGRTRGVLNSLFMIPDLRRDLNRVLQLEPGHPFAQNTLGEIDHAVPGFAGGSDDRAEATYRAVLSRNPHLTKTMVLLALLKLDTGDEEEARQWAQKVIDEKAPARPTDHRKFDIPDARKILARLAG